MRAALLINLGSPKSPTPDDVRNYLDEFLMDPWVIDLPFVLRAALVRGIILRTRPKKSAHAYQSVWTDAGSPLIAITQRVCDEASALAEIPVHMAMRYGQPCIAGKLRELAEAGYQEIFVMPMYPQYSGPTVGTVRAEVERAATKLREEYPDLVLDYLAPFHNDERYLSVFTEHLHDYLAKTEFDKVLFSFHGIPESYVRKSDSSGGHRGWSNKFLHDDCCHSEHPGYATCYRQQTRDVAHALAKRLGLSDEQYQITYQSRLGMNKWLTPDTAGTLEKLAQSGVAKIAVVSPAFVTDCLETLEELNIRGRETFLTAGGQEFTLLPCLNDDPRWVELITTWVNDWNQAKESTEHPAAAAE